MKIDHTKEEKIAIKALAGSHKAPTSIRDAAISAHRQLLARFRNSRGSKLPYGDPFFEFMREVDCPMPDLLLRHRRRQEVLAESI
jgi:hypothetical protein